MEDQELEGRFGGFGGFPPEFVVGQPTPEPFAGSRGIVNDQRASLGHGPILNPACAGLDVCRDTVGTDGGKAPFGTRLSRRTGMVMLEAFEGRIANNAAPPKP